jgi:hypothetical protein
MAYVIIKVGGDGYNHGKMHKEFLIESDADLTDIDTDEECAPGSVAYTADLTFLTIKDVDGNWNPASES